MCIYKYTATDTYNIYVPQDHSSPGFGFDFFC